MKHKYKDEYYIADKKTTGAINYFKKDRIGASDQHKAEGWHRQGPSENLLYIVDEAKGIHDEEIFHAVERCQPSRLLVMSSPGSAAGFFYEAFTKQRERWETFTVTAYDCPHLTKDWIAEQIAAYGENSSLIRSIIYG